MPATEERTLVKTEDLLTMPENGMDRWLIRGEVRERPMTLRNRFHSRVMVTIATELENWRRTQPLPRGCVLCGEAGLVLGRDPDTTVGVDVAYVSAETAAQLSEDTTLVDGAPVLAVEILSPSDTNEVVHEKIEE